MGLGMNTLIVSGLNSAIFNSTAGSSDQQSGLHQIINDYFISWAELEKKKMFRSVVKSKTLLTALTFEFP